MQQPDDRPRPITITPAGVIGSVLLLGVVLLCIRLGFWQVERHQQRRALNEAVASRMDLPPLEDLSALQDTAETVYRVVLVRGTFDHERTIVLPGRSFRGVPGVYVLTPLRPFGQADAVLVNRGWAPSADASTVDLSELTRPDTAVVRGLVLPFPDAAHSMAQREPPAQPGREAFRRVWFTIDPAALRAQYPYPLLPALLQDLAEPPAGGSRYSRMAVAGPPYPVRLEPPPLDAGPHAGYAVQWFAFGLIGIIGWIALVVRSRAPQRTAPPPAAIAALALLAFATPGAAQLRPVDPLEWRVYEPGTALVATAGVGSLWEQQASLAGSRGRLLELGNYRMTVRFDRMAVELAGTAIWRLTDEQPLMPPAPGVRPADGSPRQDPGYASAATLVDVTPAAWPVRVLLRFGARIPTTSDESGLDRDRTDFFAFASARYQRGPLALTAENGVGIHGTTRTDYPQSDVWAYMFGAHYMHGAVRGSAQLVGHQDGHAWRVRGNEDLRELRVGASAGRRRWIGATYIRGLTEYSPSHGVRISGGLRVGR
jgi:surfeit locus 1 family protein